jgi:hypothetical protein
MKLIISAFLLTLLFFSGCDQVTEINAPQERVINKQLINLPQRVGLGVETQTYTQDINGANGGEFQQSYSYQDSSGGTVYQSATLNFFPGAFTGTKNISMTFNTGGAAMDLGPAMLFQAAVKYTYEIIGADLTGINPSTLQFVYIDASGNMYAVDYDSVIMDQNTGMLKVTNAVLPHFSRYGFVN